MIKTLEWKNNKLIIVDQTLLPGTIQYIVCNDYRRVNLAIKRLEVRGAPALGAAGAYALVLGLQELINSNKTIAANTLKNKLKLICNEIISTRPTAVNLSWAVELMQQTFIQELSFSNDFPKILAILEKKANSIFAQDIKQNKKIGRNGAAVIPPNAVILTHCNAGALATCGFGTALGVIRQAHFEQKVKMVYVDETRPLLQGARLTAWELQEEKIPVTLITDSMASWVMKTKKVDCIITGADRIAANGDTANKVGTYGLAVLAKQHGIPFYIAAPLNTFDFKLTTGTKIPIEERAPEEITFIADKQVAPLNIKVFNPAFDITPSKYITGIITEHGIIQKPYKQNIKALQTLLKEDV
ncbi:MAG TPA: S-methyl-5-thioribose-1-phosphate isomerase [Candidatus Avacidaminococcus intestinavium]|uniref:Methylthioribose-1-phosphate isomerase n=1 Tax=Candidatus Avacidaminococcus intestinavium TaxID=2840684 RepID=A0A9D1MPM5_9FIRM|nr:S-methyl-5-thioribose-1-phosphate isomerase [Candidatus Avacidaminococcus intestinavium]